MSRKLPKPTGSRREPKISTVQGPGSPTFIGGAGNLFDEEHVAVQTGVVLNSELEVGEALAVQTDVVLGGAIEVGEALTVQTDVVVDTTLRETLFEMNDDGGLVADDLATGGAGNPHSVTFRNQAHIAAVPAGIIDSRGRTALGMAGLKPAPPGAGTTTDGGIQIPDSADFDFSGGADTTIEFMIYVFSHPARPAVLFAHATDNSNLIAFYMNGSVLRQSVGVGGVFQDFATADTVPLGRVVHVAVQRTGGSYYLSVDGQVTSQAISQAYQNYTQDVFIGRDRITTDPTCPDAIILATRVTNGTALYGTSDFVPPVVEDLVDDTNVVLCHHYGAPFIRDTGEGVPLDESTGGVDSPRPLTLQGLGAYFEDHDGYRRLALRDDMDSIDVAGALVIPDSDDLRPVSGTGDYCIEAILEVKRDVEDKTFLWHGIATDRVHCHLNGSGNLAWDIDTGGGSDLAISGASGWSVGDKVHVVFEKVGSDYTIYSDGAQIATGVNATAWGDFTGSAYVGRVPIVVPGNRGDFDLLGYRISKTVRYGAEFTAASFKDSSPSAHVVTAVGGVSQTADAARYGRGGATLDGVDDFLSMPDSSDWDFDAVDHCIEGWATPTDVSAGHILWWNGNSNDETNRAGMYQNGAQLSAFWRDGGVTRYSEDFSSVAVDETYFYRQERFGDAFFWWKNGSIVHSLYESSAWQDYTGTFRVGQQDLVGDELEFEGSMDDFRVSKGRAQGFPQLKPAWVDSSGNHSDLSAQGGAYRSPVDPKFGDGCLVLGTQEKGGVRVVPVGSSLDIGTGDFCFEAWVYISDYAQSRNICARGFPVGSYRWNFFIGGGGSQDGKLRWFFRDTVSSTKDVFTAATVPQDQWVHCLVERVSGMLYLAIDGTTENHGSFTDDMDDATGDLVVGNNNLLAGQGGNFNGRIDEFRWSDVNRHGGSSFSVPLSAYTSDGNTKILLHFDQFDNFLDDTGDHTVYKVGTCWGDLNSRLHTVTGLTGLPEFQGGLIPDSPDFDFGTNDFYLKFRIRWSQFTAAATAAVFGQSNLAIFGGGGGSLDAVWVALNGSDQLTFEVYNGGVANVQITGGAVAVDTDYLVEVTRTGSTFELLVNSVSQGTDTYAGATPSMGSMFNVSPNKGITEVWDVEVQNNGATVLQIASITEDTLPAPTEALPVDDFTVLKLNMDNVGAVKVLDLEDDGDTVFLWKGKRTTQNHGRWGAYGVGGINTGTPVADPYGGSRRLLVFDGIDDYVALLPPHGSDRLIRRGKHGAIDLWIYPTSSAGALRVVAERLIDASNFWVLQQETDDSLTFIIRSSGIDIINVNTGASSLTINAWNHVTVDLHDLGGVAINGTFVGLETTLGAVVTPAFTSQPVYLGTNAIALGSNLFAGYMADLRVRSGTSPYLLTNFTAPSAPPS